MIGLTDQEGNETSYSYDLMNRKTETIFEDGKQSLIAYDSIGRMLSVETFTRNAPMTVANVRTSKTYSYRHSGVVDYITFSDNRPGAVIGSYQHIFDYDDSLRRISCENQLDDVLCTYVYNDRGLMESETIDFDTVSGDNPTFQTKYEYDDMGRVSKIEYPTIDAESRSVSYAYTDRGELDTVHYPAPANEVENRAYDPGGRLVGIDRPAVDETRDYDNANRVSWIDNLGIGRLNYGYDDNGNKTSETWGNVPTTVSNWDFNINSYDAEDRFMDFQRSAAFNATTNVSFNRTNAGKSIGNIQSITEQQGDLGLELSGS